MHVLHWNLHCWILQFAKLILEVRKKYNMGIPARHEPPNMQALQNNAEVFSIFEAMGWTEFSNVLMVLIVRLLYSFP